MKFLLTADRPISSVAIFKKAPVALCRSSITVKLVYFIGVIDSDNSLNFI